MARIDPDSPMSICGRSRTEQRELLTVQAAKAYYDLDQTMGDIAKTLGLTRWQVARLLKEAREQGVVRIEIVPRAQRRPDLESRLQRAYGLREAVVVPFAIRSRREQRRFSTAWRRRPDSSSRRCIRGRR